MALIKCKMCGGDLVLTEGSSVAECEYCGSVQTVPTADNEKKLTLFARAGRLRAACEFDRAAGIYESIAAEFPEEAEAYWGLVLCRYGIEYVDDPATGKKIPTCHRSGFDSVMEDPDLEQALENADVVARRIYREEAKQIEELRKGIAAVSAKEEPYDIFICYKETAEDGDRTLDSVLAQDIYDVLTEKGYRVFFARITLEDKLGEEYEPYIFAALNSAKIMLAVGTDFEYYNAVWVKNEWSRYLKLMASDKTKHLIACYKGLDAYDMPKEFAKLQAQDLGKVGAMQDLLRGIEKILPRKIETQPIIQTVAAVDPFGTEALLRKAKIHLEEKSWKNVQETCNRITGIDPENAWAYVYQLARVMRVTDPEMLGESVEVISKSSYYEKALKYADPALKEKLQQWLRGSEECCRLAEERCEPGRRKAQKVKYLLSGGKNHTAAVMTDGTVVARGSNEKDQCDVSSWRNIVAVACGAFYTVGLRSDGTVVACGDNEYGQCNVQEWKNIVHISCDENHTVGVCADGTVVSCGNDANGKRDISHWQDIRVADCGYHHTVAMKKDGSIIAVGSNRFGQCNVSDWEGLASIYCNNVQTIGLMKNGRVVACGDSEDKRIATKMWRDIVDVGTGTHHTVGLKTDGTLIACGDDGSNRCSGTARWNNVVAVARSVWHTLAIRADGTVLVCGDMSDDKCKVEGLKLFNSIDTLDEERNEALAKRAYQDEQIRKVRDRAWRFKENAQRHITAGQEHIAGLRLDGTVAVVGSNDNNQWPNVKWRNIQQVACGEFFTLGVKDDGTVIATGNNKDGQCNVSDWSNIKKVACGYTHSAGLRKDGTVIAAGDNAYGQCNLSDWQEITEVACGYYHTVGLRADGTVVASGGNEHGQSNVQRWRDIIAIAANNLITVGLKKDGTVVACGNNEHGQCEVGQWRDIISVACGSHHVLGLRTDGTVVATGYNENNRCSDTKSWSNIVGIACGIWFSLGIKADGTVVACGDLSSGKDKVRKWRPFGNIEKYEQELQNVRNYRKNMVIGGQNWAKTVSVEAGLAILENGEVVISNSSMKHAKNVALWQDMVSVAGTQIFGVGLQKDGTVRYCGEAMDGADYVDLWQNIVQIDCRGDTYGKKYHVVGLRNDGTVLACGYNKHGQCNVSDWRNIVQICCGDNCTYGLRSDGTVVFCGEKKYGCEFVSSFKDIVKIVCGHGMVLGLRKDGTVDHSGYDAYGSEKWTDIVHVAAGLSHCVGLRADGTMVAVGSNEYGQCNVEGWYDIMSVACDYNCTVAVRSDGRVLTCGNADAHFGDIRNALAVKSEVSRFYILCSDGTIEREIYGSWKCYENAWKMIHPRKVAIPTDPAALQAISNRVQFQRRNKNAGKCRYCGGSFKGLFDKKCSKCDIEKDY